MPAWLGWACYLACSWTWCIGMFLPVLLVRDHGPWGFVVFAAPNVLGAAAMGWVLARPGTSERLVARHRPAMLVFTAVTIAFHGYLLGWIAPWADWRLLAAGGAVLALGIADAWRPRGPFDRLAETLACSALAAALFLGVGSGWTGPGPAALADGPTPDVLWLALPCMLGFALCPYLDITFHRARQALPVGAARAAFSLGFGAVFLAAIIFTLGYSGYADDSMRARKVLIGVSSLSLTLHLIAQTLFTVFAHVHAGAPSPDRDQPAGAPRWIGPRGALGLLAFGAALGAAASLTPLGIAGMSAGELGYRVFMACYGLLFPAYVWLAMIPSRDGHSGLAGPRGRATLRVLALAVGIAAPMYWMGFMAMRELWLAPGVLVVLLARLAVR